MASSWGLIAIGVITLIPYGFANSTKNFPKLNINTRSECPTNNRDIWMKLHNISCQNGFNLGCIPNANNSTEILLFCRPVDLKCQAGTRGVFTENGNIVTMTEEECPPGTYQKQESDCVDACYPKRTDFYQIPEEFAVYSNGSSTEPPQIYCNASGGWYNNKNKTFFDFDSDFTYELGYKIVCLNVKDQNPCANGLFVLPNGTCINQQERDNFMLQLERNIIDSGSGNNKSNTTIQPLTKTIEPVKTTADVNSNNLTTEANSSHVKDSSHQELIIAATTTVGGLVIVVGVIVVVFRYCKPKCLCCCPCKRRNREYQIDHREDIGMLDGIPHVKRNSIPLEIGKKWAAKFRKPDNDNVDQWLIGNINTQMPKVGAIIIDGDFIGTIFRVGEKYGITALHVISAFCLNADGTINLENLQQLHRLVMFVNFNGSIADLPRTLFSLKYCYHSENLDILIVEFSSLSGLPPPMYMSRHNRRDQVVHVIGWGNKKSPLIKHVDLSCKVILPTDQLITGGRNYLNAHREELRRFDEESYDQGFNGFDGPDIILYNGYFEHGGSGSPLLASSSRREIEVVGVLIEGMPCLYYNIPIDERHRFPEKYVLNVAVRMSSIYREVREANPDLAMKIFGSVDV